MNWESLTDDDPTEVELNGLSTLLASADEFAAGMATAVGRDEDDGALQTHVVFRVNGTPVGVIVRKNSDEVVVVTDTKETA